MPGWLRLVPELLVEQLFPFDSDAPALLPAWLDELECERCIERCLVDEVEYLRVVDWRRHQNVQHPTPSHLPPSPKKRVRRSGKTHESSRRFHEEAEESLHGRDFQGPAESDAPPIEILGGVRDGRARGKVPR